MLKTLRRNRKNDKQQKLTSSMRNKNATFRLLLMVIIEIAS
jgi:hypothetical protein